MTPPTPLRGSSGKSGIRWYAAAITILLSTLVAYPAFASVTQMLLKFQIVDPAIVILAGSLAGIAAFVFGLGISVSGQRWGICLGSRNCYSLSRFQMVLWSWLVLSAILGVATTRAWGFNGGTLESALSIVIPGDLLAVMGISFASGTISPAILAVQADGDRAPEKSLALSNSNTGTVSVRNRVVFRDNPALAKFEDLVRGDDVATYRAIDLAKVQNLVLTLILIAYYLLTLFHLVHSPGLFNPKGGSFTPLPEVSPSMVTLLAISHGGYLAYKAAPKPETNTNQMLKAYAGPAKPPTQAR